MRAQHFLLPSTLELRKLTIASGAGVATLAICLALGWIWATVLKGGTRELTALFIWTIPLAVATAVVALRPRFESWNNRMRVALTTAVGVSLGFGMTVLGYLLLGGWMLAWDFPILYVWVFGSTASTLGAAIAHRMLPARGAVAGFVAVVSTAGALIWIASRPAPALLVTYRETDDRRSAMIVYDSLLSEPIQYGKGKSLRWGIRGYAVVGATETTSDVFLTFSRRKDRDAARAFLERHYLVQSLVDTTAR